MFWYGVAIGCLVTYILLMAIFYADLKSHGISELEYNDIMRLIQKSKKNRTVVIEVWKDYDDATGNADLTGQVFLEKK